MKQNIYDDPIFHNAYMQLRTNDKGINNTLEIPAMRNLSGSVENKVILDLGCGFGHQAQYLLDHGAKEVVGVDISQKMIHEAKTRVQSRRVHFVNTAIEDYDMESEKFDMVVSSLTLHYVRDLKEVFKKVYLGLKKGGTFVFSIEHPMRTAGLKDWIPSDHNGAVPLDEYEKEGLRLQFWLVRGVKKYHRKLSSILNTLIALEFSIRSVDEPVYPGFSQIENPQSGPPILIIKTTKENRN